MAEGEHSLKLSNYDINDPIKAYLDSSDIEGLGKYLDVYIKGKWLISS